ncbi:uncharacterized protein [Miscanthus floridulus]|uniref:uncharacterized protein n=1 Tax=Miscanthus floridulus TaxID=154761 RepID=UPI00345A2B95
MLRSCNRRQGHLRSPFNVSPKRHQEGTVAGPMSQPEIQESSGDEQVTVLSVETVTRPSHCDAICQVTRICELRLHHCALAAAGLQFLPHLQLRRTSIGTSFSDISKRLKLKKNNRNCES